MWGLGMESAGGDGWGMRDVLYSLRCTARGRGTEIPRSRVCFFFQAEDGIRDLTVTGVQTCALPIFPERALHRLRKARERRGKRAQHGGEDALELLEGLLVEDDRVEVRGLEPRQIGRASCRERV